MIADEIKKLSALKDEGLISEFEFNQAKAKLLGENKFSAKKKGELFGLSEPVWLTLMHLSILAGFIIPILGLALPFILWILSKDESEKADQTGRILINWIASFIIYFIISMILTMIFIGWLLMSLLVIACIVFVILGAVKAANGTIWRYPLSISFLHINSYDDEKI